MTTRDPEQSRDPTDEPAEAFSATPPSQHQRLLAMCARKENFATWHHAETAAKRINRKKIDDRYAAPFICPVCKGIHVGSMPKRHNRKGKRP